MKRFFSATILMSVLCLATLSGCADNAADESVNTEETDSQTLLLPTKITTPVLRERESLLTYITGESIYVQARKKGHLT